MALHSMTWYCLHRETAIFAYCSWVKMKQSSTANLTMKETFTFSPNSEAIQLLLSISPLTERFKGRFTDKLLSELLQEYSANWHWIETRLYCSFQAMKVCVKALYLWKSMKMRPSQKLPTTLCRSHSKQNTENFPVISKFIANTFNSQCFG